MNGIDNAAGPRARRNWLPPAVAVAVTGASGLVAVAGLASGALTDVPRCPVMGWLTLKCPGFGSLPREEAG